jgi:hypothetical protein
VLDSDDSAAFDAPAEVDSVVKDEDHNDGDDDDDGDAATSPVDPIPLTDTALNDADDNVDEFEGGDVKDDDTDFETFGNEAHNESDVSHPHCQTVRVRAVVNITELLCVLSACDGVCVCACVRVCVCVCVCVCV